MANSFNKERGVVLGSIDERLWSCHSSLILDGYYIWISEEAPTISSRPGEDMEVFLGSNIKLEVHTIMPDKGFCTLFIDGKNFEYEKIDINQEFEVNKSMQEQKGYHHVISDAEKYSRRRAFFIRRKPDATS